MSTTILKTRVDSSNAMAARRVLKQIGLKPSDAVNALFALIASRKALPFSLAIADSEYAQEEYGMDAFAVAEASKKLRKTLRRERKAGTIRPTTGIADLKE